MEHENWLYQATNGTAPTSAARKAGVPASTIIRQLERGQLSAEVVVKIARAYRAPVLEGLVRCGIITEEEARLRHTNQMAVLQSVADQQLLEELLRRVDVDGYLAHPVLTQPLDDLPAADLIDFPGHQTDGMTDKEVATLVRSQPHKEAALNPGYSAESESDQ